MTFTLIDNILEGSSPKISAVLEDEDGTPIADTDLTSLTLTYWDELTGAFINSRNDQNVLNANQVIVTAAGVFTWRMLAADTAIIDTLLAQGGEEVKIALFEWVWTDVASEVRHGKHILEIHVTQVTNVP